MPQCALLRLSFGFSSRSPQFVTIPCSFCQLLVLHSIPNYIVPPCLLYNLLVFFFFFFVTFVELILFERKERSKEWEIRMEEFSSNISWAAFLRSKKGTASRCLFCTAYQNMCFVRLS